MPYLLLAGSYRSSGECFLTGTDNLVYQTVIPGLGGIHYEIPLHLSLDFSSGWPVCLASIWLRFSLILRISLA